MTAQEKGGWTYILGSDSLRLYVGVTAELLRPVQHHKIGSIEGFTSRYRINRLLWFEQFGEIELAILREKEIKKWRREKKLALIESSNPGYLDLSADWYKP